MKLPPRERRTPEQVTRAYHIERELAERLRQASPAERRRLYTKIYDEWHRRVSLDRELAPRADPERARRDCARLARRLQPILPRAGVVLEIGAGDGALARRLAPGARFTCALEVSPAILRAEGLPANAAFVVYDGERLPLADGSGALVLSNQILEHLHPDDARAHLARVRAVLVPGGCFLCLTPHRFSGPHDISRYFDPTATGFHLHEYTIAELRSLFRAAGFSRTRTYVGVGRWLLPVPCACLLALERTLAALPPHLRRSLARRAPVRQLLGITLLGIAAP